MYQTTSEFKISTQKLNQCGIAKEVISIYSRVTAAEEPLSTHVATVYGHENF
jgi:hypothetical protein